MHYIFGIVRPLRINHVFTNPGTTPHHHFGSLLGPWSEFCREGNSDHGLSFLFSTDLQYFWILAVQILRGPEFWSEFPHFMGMGWLLHRHCMPKCPPAWYCCPWIFPLTLIPIPSPCCMRWRTVPTALLAAATEAPVQSRHHRWSHNAASCSSRRRQDSLFLSSCSSIFGSLPLAWSFRSASSLRAIFHGRQHSIFLALSCLSLSLLLFFFSLPPLISHILRTNLSKNVFWRQNAATTENHLVV